MRTKPTHPTTKEPWCRVTGNPSGSGTWTAGYRCPCAGCSMLPRAEPRLRALISAALLPKASRCEMCAEEIATLRSRISELEDTIRLSRASIAVEYGDHDTARRIRSAIASRRGPDWTGAEVGEET